MRTKEIRLSQEEKDQLSRLKSRTGLEHWNELCRWALNISLREPTSPPDIDIIADSNTSIPWQIFSGEYGEIYFGLVKVRCLRDGLPIDDNTTMKQLRLHLKRGIGYLSANKNIRSIADLVSLAVD